MPFKYFKLVITATYSTLYVISKYVNTLKKIPCPNTLKLRSFNFEKQKLSINRTKGITRLVQTNTFL